MVIMYSLDPINYCDFKTTKAPYSSYLDSSDLNRLRNVKLETRSQMISYLLLGIFYFFYI